MKDLFWSFFNLCFPHGVLLYTLYPGFLCELQTGVEVDRSGCYSVTTAARIVANGGRLSGQCSDLELSLPDFAASCR